MAQKDNPPQRVKRNLAAEMLGSGEFENEQTAMVGGGYSMCNCFIRRDGVPLDETNNTVLPGHQINLDFTCYGGRSGVTNVQWTIPGIPFTDYVITNNATTKSAKLTRLTAADMTNIAITFYWSDPGDKDIKINFTDRYGNDCEFTSTITVLAMDSTFGASVLGKVNYTILDDVDPPQDFVGMYELHAPGVITVGIKWSGTIKIPAGSGFAKGEWNMVQLVDVETGSNQGRVDPTKCDSYESAGYVLDTRYPYFPNDTGKDYYDTAEDVQTPNGDIPGKGLNALSQSEYTLDFKTYAMFKAGETGSKWVPVCYTPWNCKWCIVLDSGDWILKVQDQTPLGDITPVVTSIHPQWDDWQPQITGHDCRPPCSSD